MIALNDCSVCARNCECRLRLENGSSICCNNTQLFERILEVFADNVYRNDSHNCGA